MNKIEIPEVGKTFNFPSSWEELSPSQISFILPMSFRVVSGELDIHEFSVQVFCHLTGLRSGPRFQYLKKAIPDQVQDAYAKISQLSYQLCSWPFQEIENKHQNDSLELRLNTPVNLLPVIKSRDQKFKGPADLIADLSFAEFRIAIREMEQHISFAKDKDLQHEAIAALDRFVAVLYQPINNISSKRTYNFDLTQTFLPLISKIPLWKKNTILLWFSYCINYIQSEDVVIDGNTVNFSVLFPKSTTQNDSAKKGIGWAGLLFDVSKEGPFGNVDKTDRAGLFDVLLYLYKSHQDNSRLQKRLKSKK